MYVNGAPGEPFLMPRARATRHSAGCAASRRGAGAQGIAEVEHGVESTEALPVSIGAPRLARLGLAVSPAITSAEAPPLGAPRRRGSRLGAFPPQRACAPPRRPRARSGARRLLAAVASELPLQTLQGRGAGAPARLLQQPPGRRRQALKRFALPGHRL